MDLGLREKVAVVTGGSEGIGKATAMRLAMEGAKVSICARREDVLKKAEEEIRAKTGGEILAIRADVSKAEQVEQVVNKTIEVFGGIDILVNNAGTSAAAPFEEASDDYWQADLDLKLFGAIRCTRLALPSMKKRGGGRIINITNIGAKQPGARSVPTSVSRAAGIALTKALSKEYAEHNILVNTVCIGLIKSAQIERMGRTRFPHLTVDEFYRERGQGVPLRRVGEAEEVADLIAFLSSERASYITGVSINIDGGTSGVV